MPKLSRSPGLSRRATRSATVASSIGRLEHLRAERGFTTICSDWRAPNSFW